MIQAKEYSFLSCFEKYSKQAAYIRVTILNLWRGTGHKPTSVYRQTSTTNRIPQATLLPQGNKPPTLFLGSQGL